MKALALVVSTGCAQILGIDNTHLPPVDAPSVCDGAPATCTSMTGRTACGQIYAAGGPLRVASPTGAVCDAANTEGPCGLAVAAQPLAGYQLGLATGRIGGAIDDCGRFVVLDVDPTAADVAIILEGAGYADTASLFLQRPQGAGVDTGVPAYAVTTDTRMAWSTQLAGADVTTGFVVTYKAGAMVLAMEEVRVDGGSVMGPATPPWTAYFADPGLQTLDPALTATEADGSAFVVPTASTFSLGGKRTGKTCQIDGMLRVVNALQLVTLTSC